MFSVSEFVKNVGSELNIRSSHSRVSLPEVQDTGNLMNEFQYCLKTNLLIFNHKKIRFSGGIITVSASISDSNMTPEKDSISYQVPERPH